MNGSNASHASSRGFYSGIGFEKTASVHFDDLKKDQDLLKDRIKEVRKAYAELRKREASLGGKEGKSDG